MIVKRGPQLVQLVKGRRLLSQFQIQMVATEETQARRCDLIVHCGVPHVPLQPVIGIAPDLTDDVGIGIDGANTPSKIAPKIVVIDFVGHIETPAIDTKFDPVLSHTQEKLTRGRAVCVEFGKCRKVPPG